MRLALLFTILFFAAGCKDKTPPDKTNASVANEKIFVPSYPVDKFEGTYSGSFGDGFITIVLNYVNGKNVSGYNLHKGTRRNINGILQPAYNGFKFILKEPGDNPFDGTFEFSVDTVQFNLSGGWTPFDSAKTKAKSFSLKKQPKREINWEEQLGTWVPATGTYSTDTTLEFSPEGTCEYHFYSKPGDSTSQMNSVKGNYIQVKDTVMIEWQKNSFTPSQKMKLVLRTKKIKNQGNDYEEKQLVGSGWKFAKMEGD